MRITGDIPTVEETMGTLNMFNSLLPQYIDYELTAYNSCRVRAQMKPLRDELEDALSMNIQTQTIDSELKTWITLQGYASLFPTTKTGISLSGEAVESVLADDTIPEKLRTVLLIYQSYTDLFSKRKALFSLLQNPIANVLSYDNHRMLEVHPEWASQNTGRLGMRKPAIQNIPRDLQYLQTVPKGYVFVHADSSQMEPITAISWILKDPIITKLYYAYKDAYYAYMHYAQFHHTLTDDLEDVVPLELTEEHKTMRKTLKTFVNAVMYGSTSNPTGNPIKANLIKYLGGHPARLAHVNKLREEINSGKLPTTYFGNPIDIYKSEKLTGSGYDENELMILAVNNPIQGTAADLMRYSVRHVRDIIESVSLKSRIINYVHDAVSLAVWEDDFDKMRPYLDDLVAYEVNGWIPIGQELQIGREIPND